MTSALEEARNRDWADACASSREVSALRGSQPSADVRRHRSRLARPVSASVASEGGSGPLPSTRQTALPRSSTRHMPNVEWYQGRAQDQRPVHERCSMKSPGWEEGRAASQVLKPVLNETEIMIPGALADQIVSDSQWWVTGIRLRGTRAAPMPSWTLATIVGGVESMRSRVCSLVGGIAGEWLIPEDVSTTYYVVDVTRWNFACLTTI
jgi:hypothetical protein